MAKLTIYEYFAMPKNGAYTKEQVKAVIETLTEKQISYIKNRNGDDLDNPTYHDGLSKEQASTYSNVLHVVREKLYKQSKESATNEEPGVKENEPKSQIKYSVIETFIKYGYTETQILTVVRLLPYNYITILKSLFGENYNEFNPNEIISHEKEAFYRTTIYPRIFKSLSDRYGNNAGEIQLTKKVIIGPTKKNRTRGRCRKKVDYPTNNQNEEILSDIQITEEDVLTKKGAEEDMKSKGKAKKSIIQKFTEKGYTKEQILSVIEQLPDNHKAGIKKMDGEDIEHPVKNPSVTKKDTELYYGTILQMIERRLKKLYGSKETAINKQPSKPKGTCAIENVTDTLEQTKPIKMPEQQIQNLPPSQTIENSVKMGVPKETKPLNTEVTEDVHEELTQPTDESLQLNNDINIIEYIKILELIKTPTFTELMTQLDVKSAIIIALRLGYIDGKYFSSEAIANFLDIEEQEVRETTSKILNLYKSRLNNFIDLAVSYDSPKGKPRKLAPEKPKTE